MRQTPIGNKAKSASSSLNATPIQSPSLSPKNNTSSFSTTNESSPLTLNTPQLHQNKQIRTVKNRFIHENDDEKEEKYGSSEHEEEESLSDLDQAIENEQQKMCIFYDQVL